MINLKGSDRRDYPADRPLNTVCAGGTHAGLVAAHMINMKGARGGVRSVQEPLATICASTYHAGLVYAFLTKYYGEGGQLQGLGEPLHTIPTRGRFGLVVVSIDGEDYVIADIGMRMLVPGELYGAQGYPDSFDIAPNIWREVRGKQVFGPPPKSTQIRLCGNSVPPPWAEALVRANCPDLIEDRAAA